MLNRPHGEEYIRVGQDVEFEVGEPHWSKGGFFLCVRPHGIPHNHGISNLVLASYGLDDLEQISLLMSLETWPLPVLSAFGFFRIQTKGGFSSLCIFSPSCYKFPKFLDMQTGSYFISCQTPHLDACMKLSHLALHLGSSFLCISLLPLQNPFLL